MRKPVFFNFFLCVCAALLWLFIPGGCANISPPTGGPRDTTAPRLLKISPPDSTRNFNEKEITLTFDEFVDLRDQANNIIFTPTFNNAPDIRANLRTITIKFREPLDTGTTYVLNFGNAIVDVNESNPYRNFTYIFSTGPTLDSLEIKGKVILAETGGIDSTLSVILHRRLDTTAVKSELPRYVVKLNRAGEFHFRYLPSDTFAVYALKGSRQYIGGSQLFAFADAPVVAGSADSVILYAYSETPPTQQSGGGTINVPGVGRIASGDRRLRINTPPTEQDLRSDYTLTFPIPLRNFDSTKIRLTMDTVYSPAAYSVELDSAKTSLHIKSEWKENTKYNLELQKDFASDTAGRQLLKADTLYFTTKKTADYGGVTLRFKNLDVSKNPVLQFVQNEKVILTASIKSGTFTQSMFTPGEYSLRILYDLNDNGKWDPGNFFKERRQPELVHPVQQAITIKPAWDNQFDINL